MADEDNENLKQTITIITTILDQNNFCEDKEKIQYLSNELKKIFEKKTTYRKMEELQKIVIDLEVKYDEFNELSNYFDPLYIFITKKIHEEKVKKLREENKRKRDEKLYGRF